MSDPPAPPERASDAATEILERLPEAAFTLDRAGRLTRVNVRAEELLGRSREELLGARARDVLPGAGAGGDGERRFRALIENAPDGITLLDRDGVIVYDSASARRRYGHHGEGFVGSRRDDLIHPDDRERVLGALYGLPPGASVTTDYRFRNAAGEWRHHKSTFTNLLEDPAVDAYVINHRDVTEEVAAREELERANRRFRYRAERLDLLHRVHLVAARASGLEASLRAILAEGLTGVDGAASVLLARDGDELEVVEAAGFRRARPVGRTLPAARSHAGSALRDGRVVTLNGDAYEKAFGSAPGLRPEGFRAYAAVPFGRAGSPLGVLELFSRRRLPEDDEWRAFMRTFGWNVTVAIENARLLERLRGSVDDYRALAEFGERIEAIHDIDRLVEHGLRSLLRQLRLDVAVLCTVEGETLQVTSAYGDFPVAVGEPGRVGEGLTGRVAATGEPLVVDDYPTYAHRMPGFERHPFRSVIALPVHGGGRVRHVVAFASLDRAAPIGPDALSVASAFVRRLENALVRLEHQAEIEATREATFRVLGLALEHRDLETKGHTDRVLALSTRFGQAVGLAEGDLQALQWGAYLHDVGKIAIPDAILLKPGRLSGEEFAVVREHAVIGARMCRDVPFLPTGTRQVIRWHHERWDGSGYPDALMGNEIPLPARLFALVDVYDALTSERPYKRAWTREEAVREIRAQAGAHFDPKLAEAFLKVLEGAG